ncbi:PREDICTED: uncharacterized protein C9orf171 homolog isoform X2 [Cyprinodon variegatus]|nr:PREDICTED: uncharacterized protein C9orf171 homolog isoform X2 [Cyprinodon variegatus]
MSDVRGSMTSPRLGVVRKSMLMDPLLIKNKAGKFAETKSSLLRRNRPLPVSQTPFKLPQFSQVPPALDTFRDPGARPRALKAPQQPQTQRGGPDHGTNSLD